MRSPKWRPSPANSINSFDHFDWVGFYRNVGNETLKIGPYQGGHGCLVIPFSKGVCGACARTRKTQLVPDVNAIPDHIACSATTQFGNRFAGLAGWKTDRGA